MTAADSPQVSTANPDRTFTLRERLLLNLITWAGFLAIRLIGPTLRYAVSWEDGAPLILDKRPVIYSFWHRCVFPATYLWRHMDFRVMTSRSFDGEYIARIIRKFGFVPLRGSSSRGAVGALLGMRRDLEAGHAVVFTIDGPRGPMYVAKAGPVLLARAAGLPMAAFHIALDEAWVLNTWDRFMIPKPFSKALMRVGRSIVVPGNTTDAEMDRWHAELQESLDRVREFAEAHVREVGREFALFSRND